MNVIKQDSSVERCACAYALHAFRCTGELCKKLERGEEKRENLKREEVNG